MSSTAQLQINAVLHMRVFIFVQPNSHHHEQQQVVKQVTHPHDTLPLEPSPHGCVQHSSAQHVRHWHGWRALVVAEQSRTGIVQQPLAPC
jgi:hypothetical protein